MSLLSHEGTRVLLVGSGSYVPGSHLPSVPASRTTVQDLGDCLVDRAGLDPRTAHQVRRSEMPGAGPWL
ncbi:hypothetical protein OG884_02285 [Streptosporangium sp. NBC_01755]|uniref:hypothetical protein n=1 Tax=unclassified Streptosporangium TaxID=2632669 RepID=UPI002DDBB6C3|nr:MULTISPECIES: hypothetical protein [unclassified Streptosporangium]WSA27736.1 hypothetical protein OIE13_07645 [Streptosporangium sp. NBC_01810]WSD00789.1 hypothetical protein OG884_02285 [Streptosporangium sp. NBC_01755]